MLVGVCCTCQQGGKPLRYERGRALIDSHSAFGYFCQGSGTVPQATYEIASGSDQMPEGVQVVNGSSEHNVCSPDIYPDDLDRMADPHAFERARDEQRAFDDQHNAKHGYALSDCPEDRNAPDPECCFDPWCNHRPDPPKSPGVFGTIGDIILAAKNGKKTKKRG